MGKEDLIKLEGEIIDVLPNATFRIKIDDMEHIMLGVISGRMRQHNIKCLLGDRVEIECSTYDLNRGRIVRRG